MDRTVCVCGGGSVLLLGGSLIFSPLWLVWPGSHLRLGAGPSIEAEK